MGQIKNLDMNVELKEELRELAYRSRVSMSEYVKRLIVAVANGDVEAQPRGNPRINTTVKYDAPPEFEVAMKKAQEVGVPLAEVLRQEIARRAEDEGPQAPQPEAPLVTREDHHE